LEKFNSLQAKIEGLENANDELKNEVHHAETGLYDDGMELDKNVKNSNAKVQKELKDIIGDNYSNIELAKYGGELWKSLEEFEKTLYARELVCEEQLK